MASTPKSVGSVGNVKAISSKLKWQINDFRKCCDMNVGECLVSPMFIASSINDKVKWYFMLYPRGQDQNYKDYLSLYIFTDVKIEATVDFKILNNKSEVVVHKTVEEYTFGFGKLARGFPTLVSTDFITNSANCILNSGNLTIMSEITTMPRYKVKELKKLSKEEEEREAALTSQLEVLKIYDNLLKDSTFSDVSLISEGKAIKAHKCILSKNSSVFAAMFSADMKEKQENIVKIVDIRHEVLVEMIRFVYTGKVNGIDALVDELAIAADKYALHRLKTVCENTMLRNLSIGNVVNCLLLADKLRIDKLKMKAVEFIVENASDITEKPEFQSLPYDIVCKVCCGLAKKNK